MKKILTTLLFLPMLAFAQEESQYNDQNYIRDNAIEALELMHFALNKEDYQFAAEMILVAEGVDKVDALKQLIENDDLTRNGIKAMSESGELVAFNAFRNADAHNLMRDLGLDFNKCWAIQVPSNVADCWFYFDGPTDKLQFFKLRNIRVME